MAIMIEALTFKLRRQYEGSEVEAIRARRFLTYFNHRPYEVMRVT
jgi:hypothetical protein